MKKRILLLWLLVGASSIFAQQADYNVIPLPKEVKVDSGKVFGLRHGMGVSFDASDPEIARNVGFLCDWVKEVTGLELKLAPNDKKAAIRFSLGLPEDQKAKKGEPAPEFTNQQKEAYVLSVGKDGITIQARNAVGFYRAAQTLRKALPVVKGKVEQVELPFVTIKDEPRFEYRGVP